MVNVATNGIGPVSVVELQDCNYDIDPVDGRKPTGNPTTCMVW